MRASYYQTSILAIVIAIAVISPSDKFSLFVFMFHMRWVLEQLLMAHRPTAHTRTCSRSSSVIVNAGTYVKQKIDTAATIDLANANSPSLRWHQDIRSKSNSVCWKYCHHLPGRCRRTNHHCLRTSPHDPTKVNQ